MMKKYGVFWVIALLLAGCGGGGSGGSGVAPTTVSGESAVALASAPPVTGSSNVVSVVVDRGPVGDSVNQLYTSVTICRPGSTTQCQTIDHVLVDTGSSGLRLLSSVLSSSFNLPLVKGSGGEPAFACVNFIDNSFAWGPVASADVRIGGETVSGTSIQVIGSSAFNSLSGSCSSSGSSIVSPSDLGANGILGVGLAKQDCGSDCDPTQDANAQNGIYFTCTSGSCDAVTGTTMALAQQVQQPVSLFSADNNGLAIVLGTVSAGGQSGVTGAMYFGLGTQSNNVFVGLTTLATDGNGYITTQLPGNTLNAHANLTTSFLDTGSNGLFFDSNITQCTGYYATLYCPTNNVVVSAILGRSSGPTVPVTATIGDAVTLLGTSYAAVPMFGGTANDAYSFDWGLPLFFNRTVVLGIEGQSLSFGTGPFYAL